mmetsp:Transcript_61757/g.188585  ORF Transcript_61757/g.188585 Transcript_61757/m.188585 type:complete len:286 (-) Transcript_61757:49-906(-)
MLRGLRLLAGHLRDVRAMAPRERLLGEAELQLPQSLDEWHGLDVADCATQLDHANLRPQSAPVHRDLRRAVDPLGDPTGDVRDDLHGLAEVVAPALLLDHVVVDLAGGQVVVPHERQEHHPLVVAQVEIRLATVVEHEHLPVFVRAHQACVDVQVRVQLDGGHPEAVPPEERADRGRRHSLAQGAADAPGHDDVLRALVDRGPEERRLRRRRGLPGGGRQQRVEVVQAGRRGRHRGPLRGHGRVRAEGLQGPPDLLFARGGISFTVLPLTADRVAVELRHGHRRR